MAGQNFRDLLEAQWEDSKFVCVGLDSEFGKIPEAAHQPGNECAVDVANTIVAFNRAIVEAMADTVCAFKPNSAFYEAHGAEGAAALHRTIRDIHAIAPAIPVILDFKRGDIGNTNVGYVEEAFGYYKADAVTVHPYLGAEALQPFLDRADKGILVLCRTSNKGAGEFQDQQIFLTPEDCQQLFYNKSTGECTRDIPNEPILMPVYQFVAYRVANHWNKNSNCALVVGATFPEELAEVRKIVGDMPILIPGVGFQQKGVPLETQVGQVVTAGKNSGNKGMIINSSRGIIFASNGPDFAGAAHREAMKLDELIAQYL
ncbi:MAG: orotidine-5'-phosphate decarboxylase [Patescibacteria group bacterium]|nr:orotidine-5'-phosphate decarboxylase [Patescibacteria group bacterium]